MNMENAIRGARNPMNSWGKSDSRYCGMCDDRERDCEGGCFIMGDNDLDLAKRLCNAGSDHRKFMRQIFVSVDITAPLYWWKEYDTYKVGTTANSCSTMHKIHSKDFTRDDFSYDKMTDKSIAILDIVIKDLNCLRKLFVETKDKQYWYSMIQLLPSSYNQLRTCTVTYENLRNMYHSRKNHKLDEWKEFCRFVATLPYAKELIIGEDK